MDKEKLETEAVLKTQSNMGKHAHSPQAQMGKDDGVDKMGEKLERGKRHTDRSLERGRKRGSKGKGQS